jgi:hypothetical protein
MNSIRSLVLVAVVCAVNPVCGFAQEQDQAVATISFPNGVFKGSLLDPGVFLNVADSLIEEHKDNLGGILRDAISEQSERERALSYLPSELRSGEIVSVDWRGDKCVVRVISETERTKWLELSSDSVPRDARSKEFYQVKRVWSDGLKIEREKTQIAIPLQSIIYVQRGTEPLAN